MIFPALPQTAQAEEAESKVSLSVAPVISLSLQDTVAVEVTPTQDGIFSSNTAALSISTNNETGYSLYLATGNGENTLTSQNPGTSDVISAVNGGDNGVTSTGFGNNTWGYNLSQEAVSDTTAYKAVPTATGDTAIISTESPTEADHYNLTFGTKVDTSLPSGTYSNDVVVSVVANPAYVPLAFNGITTMQEMTSEICAEATENETTRLTDTRDGKQYWVAKLADGNCWMTQNLSLDLSTDIVLTPENTDISTNWTPKWDTQTDARVGITDDTETLSWNLGSYVLSKPTAWESCDGGLSAGDPVPSISACIDGLFVDVSNMSPMDDISANGVVLDGTTYDAHYLVGNYYQWNAATAGTGSTIANTDAAGSICPKGWHLPAGNTNNGGSFYYLLSQYGFSSAPTTGDGSLVLAPLYFVSSGDIELNWASISPQTRAAGAAGLTPRAGSLGTYWSSTASSVSYAYSLRFSTDGVSTSSSYRRYSGHSIRCLAR